MRFWASSTLGQIAGQCLKGVVLANLDQIEQTGFLQILAGPRHLSNLELRGDDPASAIIAKGRGHAGCSCQVCHGSACNESGLAETR